MFGSAYDRHFRTMLMTAMIREAYGDPYSMDGEVDRGSFAPISDRAIRAQRDAEKIFLDHLASVDTTKGAVEEEIIKFHLVPDAMKAFKRFVKDHGCTATSRKLTRVEQDKINKTRKSLMQYTSVKVTFGAQSAYLEKHPEGKTRTEAPQKPTAKARVPLSQKFSKNVSNQVNSEPSGSGSATSREPLSEKLNKRTSDEAGFRASGSGSISKKAKA